MSWNQRFDGARKLCFGQRPHFSTDAIVSELCQKTRTSFAPCVAAFACFLEPYCVVLRCEVFSLQTQHFARFVCDMSLRGELRLHVAAWVDLEDGCDTQRSRAARRLDAQAHRHQSHWSPSSSHAANSAGTREATALAPEPRLVPKRAAVRRHTLFGKTTARLSRWAWEAFAHANRGQSPTHSKTNYSRQTPRPTVASGVLESLRQTDRRARSSTHAQEASIAYTASEQQRLPHTLHAEDT